MHAITHAVRTKMSKLNSNHIGTFFLLILSSKASGMDFSFNPSPPSKQQISLRTSGMFYPKPDSGFFHSSFSARVPVLKQDQDGVCVSLRYHELGTYSDSIPYSTLRSIQLGVDYTHQVSDKKLWSLSASFGSASDKPFKDSDVNTIGANWIYSFPQGDNDQWVVLVNYSNNRPILNHIPLPGVAYTHAPSKQFRGTFGIPFASIYWEFVDRWSLTLFTVAPWVARAQVAYSIVGPIQAFSGFDFSQMTFLRYGRTNTDDRLYYDEKKAFIGIRSPLSRIFFAEIESGYAFARRIFETESYELHPENPIEVESSLYIKLSLSARF